MQESIGSSASLPFFLYIGSITSMVHGTDCGPSCQLCKRARWLFQCSDDEDDDDTLNTCTAIVELCKPSNHPNLKGISAAVESSQPERSQCCSAESPLKKLCKSSNHPSLKGVSAALRAKHNFAVVRLSKGDASEAIKLAKMSRDAAIPRGICWDHVLIMPSIDALNDKATEIARTCIELKVGITTNLSWRWYFCEGRNMSSYFHAGWSKFIVLTVDYGEVAGRQEVRLIDHLRRTCGTKTKNVRDGFDGPVKTRDPMFVYLAIMLPIECMLSK